MNLELLYGVYELQNTEKFINGVKTNLNATSGMFTFTRDRRMSVVSGSTEWVMAYTGTFEIKDFKLLMKAEACVKRELEGTVISRDIEKMDGEFLVLVGGDRATNYTVLTWKKKVDL